MIKRQRESRFVTARHQKGCQLRVARDVAAAVECEHGYDVCPECDPCTCVRFGVLACPEAFDRSRR